MATAATAVAASGLALAAQAQAQTTKCTVVRDHVTKTDNGHGSPAAWADLSMQRTVTVNGDAVTLEDKGSMWTRIGAGSPNGSGGQIGHRVKGSVHGVYHLTATGGQLAHCHGDTSLSTSDYIKSLFTEGTTITGGAYNWTYTTRCEKWVDASSNNDGLGEQAGNITGKRCGPIATPTPTPPATTPTPTPPPTESTPPGQAPAPTPVNTDLPVTG